MWTAARSRPLSYLKTLEGENYHHRHHDLHLPLPYRYLLYQIRRRLPENGHGRRVGGHHHIYPLSSHRSLLSGRPSSPSPFLSLLPPNHPPPHNCFHRKSRQQLPLLEYRPPTPPTMLPSSHTHFPTSRQHHSGTYLRH